MKTNTTFYKIIILTIAVIVLSSCVQNKKTNISADVAQHGVALSQLSEQCLSSVNSMFANQSYKKEYLQIVNNITPEKYEMSYETNHNEEIQNLYKANALNCLKSVFFAYKLQFDSRVSEQESGVRSKIFACCIALDSMSISEELKNKSNNLRRNINNTKYNLRKGIYELTNIYTDFWREESLSALKKMSIIKEESTKGIQEIPVEAFDTQKLKKIVEEPYENEYVLANLYKLQMLKENNEKFAEQENQIQKITKAFDLLTQLQAELLKRKQNPVAKRELNNKLDLLLKE